MDIQKRFLSNVDETIDDQLGTGWRTGGNGNGNGNITTPANWNDIIAAGAGATLDIQSTITLPTTGNFRGGVVPNTNATNSDNLQDLVPIAVGDYWIADSTGSLFTGATSLTVSKGQIITSDAVMTTAGSVVNTNFNLVTDPIVVIPAGQTWLYSTGFVDVGNNIIDYNGSQHKFNGTKKGLDFSQGKGIGKIYLMDEVLFSSNFGFIDDNLPTTDNWNVGHELLYAANQNSGTLRFNPTDTGVAFASTGYPNNYNSAYFPISNETVWLVGNGYDNVTVDLSGMEIKTIPNNTVSSKRFMFYNTTTSQIINGKLTGDRYDHFYDQTFYINTAATSAGNINLVLLETAPHDSTEVVDTINATIPLTLSDAPTNAQEVANYITNNIAGYTATYFGLTDGKYKFVVRGAGGNDFRVDTFADVSSGATLSDDYATVTGFYEGGHGIGYGSGSFYCRIAGVQIYDFHGDCIASQTQGNGTTAIRHSAGDLTRGSLDFDGTITPNVSGDYWYMTNTRALPKTNGQYYSMASNAQASIDLLHYKYWIAYYDDDDNFIKKSNALVPYERYSFKPEWTRYRIIVEDNGTNINDFYYFINSRSENIGSIIENCDLMNARRQGLSDPSVDFILRNCRIMNTGGTEPQFAVDLEDNHKHTKGWVIDGCEFQNNTNGDIIIKGASQGQIINCTFKQNSYSLKGVEDNLGLAIDTGYGRYITISNNNFIYKDVSLDIATLFTDNQAYNSRLTLKPGGCMVKDNLFVNSQINGGIYIGEQNSQSAGSDGAISYVEDNVFRYNEGWGNSRWSYDQNSIAWINNKFLFNDKIINAKVINEENLRDILIGSTSNTYMRSDGSTANLPKHQGYSKSNDFTGLKAIPSQMHAIGMTKFASNLENEIINFPLLIENGYAKNFHIKNTTAYTLWLKLGEYATDGIGAFTTIKIKDSEFTVPANIDANEGYLNNSQYGGTQLQNFLRVRKDVNVNLIFKNCDFTSEDTTTGLFMYLGNRGTTTFIDCTFDAPNAENIDFTNTGSERTSGVYAGANTGAITITNATTPGNRITFTGATVN